MKASDLILEIQAAMKTHGDLEITFEGDAGYEPIRSVDENLCFKPEIFLVIYPERP